jgi:hypothetical protein
MVMRQAPRYRILRQVDLRKGTFDSTIWAAEERATGAVEMVVVIGDEDGGLVSQVAHPGPAGADWFVETLRGFVEAEAGWTAYADLRREQLLAERGEGRVAAEERNLADLCAHAVPLPNP